MPAQSVEDVEARILQLVVLLPDLLLKLERIKADIVLQLVQDPQVLCQSQTRLWTCVFVLKGSATPLRRLHRSISSTRTCPASLTAPVHGETDTAQAIANKLIRLREALPNTDISKLVARSPAVLLELDPSKVASRASKLRWVHRRAAAYDHQLVAATVFLVGSCKHHTDLNMRCDLIFRPDFVLAMLPLLLLFGTQHCWCALCCRLFLPPNKDAEELIDKEPALLFVELDAVVSDIRRLMPTADPRTVRSHVVARPCAQTSYYLDAAESVRIL